MSSDTNKMHPLAEEIVAIGESIPPGAWPEDELRGITRERLAEMLAQAANAGGLMMQWDDLDVGKAVECAFVTASLRNKKFDSIARELLRRAEAG